MTDKLRQAIEQTVAILGPEAPLCSGCVEEWTEALRILNDVLAQQAAEQEPFGYFKADPFGWTDCAPDDEGAIALYKAPQPAKPAEQEPFGYVSEHNCEGPYRYQFHLDQRQVYWDNCKSVKAVYTAPHPAKPAEQEPVAQRWQPIETAPKGRIVLVYYKNSLGNGRTMRARYYLPETLDSDTTESGWADEGWYEESEAYEYLMPLEHQPTHWMPLPAAPEAPQPAKPAEREPVAWAIYDTKHGGSKSLHWPEQHSPNGDPEQFKAVPLYPAPQPAKREPLTDREVGAIMEELNAYGTRLWEFARAIERAHGITGEQE